MRWALVVFVWAASSVFAGTTDDAVPDVRYREYASGFSPYTLRIVGRSMDGSPALASGVAISDHWALTAAHVAHDLTACTAGGKAVDLIAVHPQWRGDDLGWHGIAALHVGESFGLAFYPPLSQGGEAVGDVVLMAGYGVTGRLSTGYVLESPSDGLLRAGTGKVVRHERAVVVLCPRRGLTPLPFMIAPGDSGGPLFIGGKLAGINSFTMADRGPLNSREGEETGHTRVSLYLEWIAAVQSLTPAR